MANKRREDLQRAATLLLIHRHRYGVRQAARILGVPRSTVMDWKRQGPAGILHPRLRMIAQKAVDGLTLAASEENEITAYFYEVGGSLPDGDSQAVNLTGRPERITREPYDLREVAARTTSRPGDAFTALFASRAEANKSAKDRAEADNEGKDPQEGQEKAGDAAESTAEDNSDPAQRRGPGEPLPPATTEAGIPVLPEDTGPPILDKLNLLAWHRYFTLLQNDVAHHVAVDAVQNIDPDFSISDEQAKRAIHALGKGDQPVKFASNWSAGNVAPPQYVSDVYEAFRWDSTQERELADYIYRIAVENYLAGINDQLAELDAGMETAVTDQGVLEEIRAEADLIAQGIGQTFDRDLAAETATRWVELSAERGKQMSRRWLEEAIRNWSLARAEWKASQIAATETSRWRNRGVMDFVDRNRATGTIMVERIDVEPAAAECPKCVDLVNGAPYPPDHPLVLDIPLHPACQHFASPVMVPVENAELGGLWTAQDVSSGDVAA